jgi:hypothetical protein
LYRTPEGEVKARQIVKTRADGTPVPREIDARDDLTRRAGIPTDTVPMIGKGWAVFQYSFTLCVTR